MAIIAPIRPPDGKISHCVAVKDDITEREQIAKELTRHREHLLPTKLSGQIEH